jgi:DNA-binding transcriptional regulator YiaG
MSERLSFRERLERRENTAGKSPVPSGSPVSVVLRLAGVVGQPVTLIQILACWGLGLRKAHEVVTRLVDGEKMPVLLAEAPEPVEVVSTLERLGVAVGFPHPPTSIDVKAIRAKLGLTQKEFAARFCFDVDSVQNWEQGRYHPDSPTRILLKVIEQHPEAVDDVLG